MAKSKKTTTPEELLPEFTNAEEQVPEMTAQAERAEKLKELWDAYFAAPKAKKKPIMDQYNSIAQLYNTLAGFNCMTIISSSTKDSIKSRPVNAPVILKSADAPEAAPVVHKKGSVIEQIIELHKQGKTNKQIINMGFNKSTVGRQVSEYKKRNAQ